MLHSPGDSDQGHILLHTAKKYIEKILTIIGDGRGIKFEVANVELPESLTCWVVSDDDPTYMFGMIYRVFPEMLTNNIPTNLTALDNAPTQVIDKFRVLAFCEGRPDDGQYGHSYQV